MRVRTLCECPGMMVLDSGVGMNIWDGGLEG